MGMNAQTIRIKVNKVFLRVQLKSNEMQSTQRRKHATNLMYLLTREIILYQKMHIFVLTISVKQLNIVSYYICLNYNYKVNLSLKNH